MNRMNKLFIVVGVLSIVGIMNCGEKNQTGEYSEKGGISPGKAIFEANCASCHGMTGEGDGPAGAALNPRPRNYAKDGFKYGSSLEEVRITIKDGVEGTAMASYADVLSDEQITKVAEYVKSLATRGVE